jgi:hypothetical protein
MLLPDAREAIVTTCQELSRAGLVVGTAGNVSVRAGDLIAVTPSGVRYAALTPELVGVHRLDGTNVGGTLPPNNKTPPRRHRRRGTAHADQRTAPAPGDLRGPARARRGRAHALAGGDRAVRAGG